MEEAKLAPKNFIEEFIQQDIQEKGLSHIQTRFPPSPYRSISARIGPTIRFQPVHGAALVGSLGQL